MSVQQDQSVAGFVMEDDVPLSRGIEPAGWLAFGCGVFLALLTELWPLLRVLVGYFVVLVHELGHTLAGWAFGYPSLPAFDFTYGGGVTLHQEKALLLVAAVYALFAVLAWVFRGNRVSLSIVVGLVVVYTGLAFTGGSDVVMIAMGHGAELVFAALFIHRSLSGKACHHNAERVLYAWIGFHIIIHDLRFAHGLITNAFQRELYGDAKGGGHWMDFSRLANEFFAVSLETVAAVFFVLCLLAPLAALTMSWLRPELAALRERLGEL
jgi:hypothetical protein